MVLFKPFERTLTTCLKKVVWTGTIRTIDPDNVNEAIENYVETVVEALKEKILTAKIPKATKGSDIFEYKLRALRFLRGKSVFLCLVAA